MRMICSLSSRVPARMNREKSKRIFYRVPAPLAARRDLPSSAKIILAIIAFRIGRNGVAWPGIRKLAADAGLNSKTVSEAILRLEAAGDLLIERQSNGQTNIYRLPSSSCFHDLAKDKTTPETGTVRKPGRSENRDGPTHKTGTLPCTKPGQKRREQEKHPPAPPGKPGGTGGGAVGGSDVDGGGKKRRRLSAAEKAVLKSTIERIGEAYRSVIGADMPHSWRTKISGEFKNGDRAALGEIGAEILSAVAAMCAARGQIFCLANVVATIHAAKRSTADAERRRQDVADRQRADDEKSIAEATARAAAAKETAARLAVFRKLPKNARDHWISEAVKQPGPPIKRADILEGIAAMLYWGSGGSTASGGLA